MLGQELPQVIQHLVELVLLEELLQGVDQVDHVLVAILRSGAQLVDYGICN